MKIKQRIVAGCTICAALVAMTVVFAGCQYIVSGVFPNSPDDMDSPALTGSVAITGTPQLGQTLAAYTGGLNGNGTIYYIWKRGNSADAVDVMISSASTYMLVGADVGKYITVTVTRAGYAGSITSTVTGPIIP